MPARRAPADDVTFVEHRAVTPDGKVLQTAVMPDYERWLPEWPCLERPGPGEYAYETRMLPDGEREPSAVIRQPGRLPVVVTRWTI